MGTLIYDGGSSQSTSTGGVHSRVYEVMKIKCKQWEINLKEFRQSDFKEMKFMFFYLITVSLLHTFLSIFFMDSSRFTKKTQIIMTYLRMIIHLAFSMMFTFQISPQNYTNSYQWVFRMLITSLPMTILFLILKKLMSGESELYESKKSSHDSSLLQKKYSQIDILECPPKQATSESDSPKKNMDKFKKNRKFNFGPRSLSRGRPGKSQLNNNMSMNENTSGLTISDETEKSKKNSTKEKNLSQKTPANKMSRTTPMDSLTSPMTNENEKILRNVEVLGSKNSFPDSDDKKKEKLPISTTSLQNCGTDLHEVAKEEQLRRKKKSLIFLRVKVWIGRALTVLVTLLAAYTITMISLSYQQYGWPWGFWYIIGILYDILIFQPLMAGFQLLLIYRYKKVNDACLIYNILGKRIAPKDLVSILDRKTDLLKSDTMKIKEG